METQDKDFLKPLDFIRKKLESDLPSHRKKFPSVHGRSLSYLSSQDYLNRDISHRYDSSMKQKSNFELHEAKLKEILGIKQDSYTLPTSLNELQIFVQKSSDLDSKEKVLKDLESIKNKAITSKEKFLGKVIKEGGLLYRTQNGLLQPQICKIYDQIAKKSGKTLDIPRNDLDLGAPSSRKEVEIIITWLEFMIKTHIDDVKDLTLEDKLSRAQLIYTACYKEVIRQISVHCIERGILMQRIWNAQIDLYCLKEDNQIKQIEDMKERIQKIVENSIKDYKIKLETAERLCKDLKDIIRDKDRLIDTLKVPLDRSASVDKDKIVYKEPGISQYQDIKSTSLKKQTTNPETCFKPLEIAEPPANKDIIPRKPVIMIGYFDTQETFYKQKIIHKMNHEVHTNLYFDEIVSMAHCKDAKIGLDAVIGQEKSVQCQDIDFKTFTKHKFQQFPERRFLNTVKTYGISVKACINQDYRKNKDKEEKKPDFKGVEGLANKNCTDKATSMENLNTIEGENKGDRKDLEDIENTHKNHKSNSKILVVPKKNLQNKSKSNDKITINEFNNDLQSESDSNEYNPILRQDTASLSQRNLKKPPKKPKKIPKNPSMSRKPSENYLKTKKTLKELPKMFENSQLSSKTLRNSSISLKPINSLSVSSNSSSNSSLKDETKPKIPSIKQNYQSEGRPKPIRKNSAEVYEDIDQKLYKKPKTQMKFTAENELDVLEPLDQGLHKGAKATLRIKKNFNTTEEFEPGLGNPKCNSDRVQSTPDREKYYKSFKNNKNSKLGVDYKEKPEKYSNYTNINGKTKENLDKLEVYSQKYNQNSSFNEKSNTNTPDSKKKQENKACQVIINPIPYDDLSRAQILSSIQQLKSILKQISKDETKKNDLLKDFRSTNRGKKLEKVLNSLFTIPSCSKSPIALIKLLHKSTQTANTGETPIQAPEKSGVDPETPPDPENLKSSPTVRKNSPSKFFQRSKKSLMFEEFTLGKVYHKVVITHPGQKMLNLVLQSINLPSTIPSPISLKSLMKNINLVYSEKAYLCRENPSYKKYEACMVLYDFLTNMYGLKTVSETKFKQIILSTLFFRDKNPRVKNFSKFLGLEEDYTVEDWNFYLNTLEIIEYCTTGISFYYNNSHYTSISRALYATHTVFDSKLPENIIENILRTVESLRIDQELLNNRKGFSQRFSEIVNTDEYLDVALRYYKGVKAAVYEKVLGKYTKNEFLLQDEFRECLKNHCDADVELLDKVFDIHAVNKKENDDKVLKVIGIESVASIIVDHSLIDTKDIKKFN